MPKGEKLVTLRDAALHITKLPKYDAKEWQAAMEALILVAELDGPTMFARDDASAKSEGRAGAQPRPERSPLGTPQAGEGSMRKPAAKDGRGHRLKNACCDFYQPKECRI